MGSILASPYAQNVSLLLCQELFNEASLSDAGNLMYLSHGGAQAGRVQSDPARDPFVCGQCIWKVALHDIIYDIISC